ncbi:MAG: DUF6089 family protein [Cytophagales bacterium]
MKSLAVFLFLSCLTTFAQKAEVGVMAGAYTSKGEMNRFPNPLFSSIGGGAFFRYNVTPVSAFRLAANVGTFWGTDAVSSQYMNKQRNGKFFNSIIEGILLYEYNFLNYRENSKTFKRSSKWSPYICGGLGFFNSTLSTKDSKKGGLCFPMGLGLKYKLTKKLNIGADVLARKTFIDGLDGQNNLDNSTPQTSYQTDKDWYYSACVTFSYTFYSIHCPENSRK